jgi:general stress protein YciG
MYAGLVTGTTVASLPSEYAVKSGGRSGGQPQENAMSIDEKDLNANQNEGEETPHRGESTTAGSAGMEEQRPRRRGFAAMDRDRVKAIASKGGRAAHAAGTAHQFSSDEARVAGKKGGMAPHVRRGGVRRRPQMEGGSVNQVHNQTDGR